MDKSFPPDEPVINVHMWLMRRVYRFEPRDHPVLWVKAHSTTYDELGNPEVKEILLTHYNPYFIGDIFSPGTHVELQVRYSHPRLDMEESFNNMPFPMMRYPISKAYYVIEAEGERGLLPVEMGNEDMFRRVTSNGKKIWLLKMN